MSDTAPGGLTRNIGIALIVLALLVTGTALAVGISRDSGDTPPPGFVYAEDGEFKVDGEPFYYAGANAYTLMFSAEPMVDVFMKTFAEENLKVARAWAFFETGTADGEMAVEGQTSDIFFHYWDEEAGAPAYNDGPNGLERLDYMLYSAAQYDVKLVLPLVNNWTAYGGIDQYVRWADGEYHDDFFTDPEIKQWYKNWVEHVLERENPLTGIKYKDDPTVLAWELGNELRCSESGPYPSSDECGSEMLVEWADEMSTFVKSIDPHHMVGFGGEGFLCTQPDSGNTLFNCEESADPVATLELENIDVHGIHVYPNHWTPTEPTDDWEDWGVWWIEQHGQIANDAGKPYYIGEYGWIEQAERAAVFDNWLRAFYENGGDGSHFWLMQPAASIAPPADNVGFSQDCPGPACELVGNWTLHMNEGVDWDQFSPIAVSDFATAQFGETITLDILANDKLYGDAQWDLATLDLDPATPGVQTEFDSERGIFRVEGGQVTFESDPEASGTARISYIVSDDRGNPTGETRVAVARSEQAEDLVEIEVEASPSPAPEG